MKWCDVITLLLLMQANGLGASYRSRSCQTVDAQDGRGRMAMEPI